jgi:hypothetical protein
LALRFFRVLLSLWEQTQRLAFHSGWRGVMILGVLLGAVLLIIGLGYYAKGKGYSAVLGLLGLFSCIGLLILAVLPDKTKDQGHGAG